MADTEREELARLMFETQRYPNKWNDLHDDLKEVRRIDADAILAAGYRKTDPSTEAVVKLDRETVKRWLGEGDPDVFTAAFRAALGSGETR